MIIFLGVREKEGVSHVHLPLPSLFFYSINGKLMDMQTVRGGEGEEVNEKSEKGREVRREIGN